MDIKACIQSCVHSVWSAMRFDYNRSAPSAADTSLILRAAIVCLHGKL